MDRFNRLNDLFIKYLLGSEARKDLTLAFLNAILADGEERFKDIVFTNKDMEPERFLGKLSKLDVKGVLDTGELIDIEVQVHPYEFMSERSLYYWSRMYSGELGQSEQYAELKPAIVLNIFNYIHLPEEEDWHNCYRVLNARPPHRMLTNHLEIHCVELPKLRLSDVRRMKSGEKWAAYLSGKCTKEEMGMLAVTDPNIIKALQAEEYFRGSDEYREYYEEREKAIRDYLSMMTSAKRTGLAEGLEQGLKQGIEQGIERGTSQGIASEKVATVLRMLSGGAPLDTIVMATALSPADIRSIAIDGGYAVL